MLRRALVLLLAPLMLGACGVSAGPVATPSAAPVPPVDEHLLQQWSAWSMTPPGRRGHCAPDPQFGSNLWFLAAPSVHGVARWSCTVPAGTSMVVVTASMSGGTLPLCSREHSEQVGVDGSASLDGMPVALRWLGPVDDPARPGPHRPYERTCALTGITVPMAVGYHMLITQCIISGLIDTVTITIDAR